MKIQRINIHYNGGDLENIGIITDQKEMDGLFKNEVICAQSDFDYREKHYLIEEVYLSADEAGMVNLFLAVSED